jgi:hypothetical protein
MQAEDNMKRYNIRTEAVKTNGIPITAELEGNRLYIGGPEAGNFCIVNNMIVFDTTDLADRRPGYDDAYLYADGLLSWRAEEDGNA